ncbi:hypothetical protein [Erysipelatoclostridium sp. An173]|uniref:hypothetical protein n=1 Tax=Erysipelatoclostridium sp. An173 TaxID=1965571 RepID=UPI00320B9359
MINDYKLYKARKSDRELIEKANRNDAIIICTNENRRYEIMYSAKVFNIDIHKPLIIDEVISYNFKKGNYIVDHVDDIAQMIIYRYILKPLWQKGTICFATTGKIYLPDVLEAEYDTR